MSARRVWLTVFALGGALLVGCGGDPPSGASPEPQRVRLALDWVPNTNHSGIFIAKESEALAAAGIRLEIVPYSGTSPEVLVSEGKADLGVSFPSALLIGRAAGLSVRAVAAINQENQEAIAVLASSDFRRPRDLSRARTYLGFGSPAEVPVLEAVIRADGGTPRFTTAFLQTAAYEALYARRGDFSTTFEAWEPIEATLRTPPVALRLFRVREALGERGNWPTAVLVASDEGVTANADVLRRTLGAIARGYETAAADPGAAVAALTSADPALARRPELVRRSATFIAPSYLRADGTWGRIDAGQLKGLAEILVEAGALKDPDKKTLSAVDVNAAFTTALLEG